MSDEIPENPNRLELEIYYQFADRVEEDPDEPLEPVLCSNFDEYEPVKRKVLDAYGADSFEELTEYVGEPTDGIRKVGVAYRINGEFTVEVNEHAA